jgi:drug/metabolite transporter (DMT)-like permease
MHVRYSLLASQATTAIFVLLWGSAAIFTRWGLDNASPMALLVFRFLIALVAGAAGCPRRAPACRQRPPA